MTGTDEAEAAATAADEALYVLTAMLLTPAQFPSVLGDDYPEACAALDLGPYAQGYGLVLGQDGTGARWTVVVDDVSLVAVAIASWDCGMEYDLSPDERSVVAALPGWPLELAIAAPGVPAPHDPAPDPQGPPPLSPPDTSQWGPAQRRLGADEIALQWTAWREQLSDDAFLPADGSEAEEVAAEAGAAGEDVDAEGGSVAEAVAETPEVSEEFAGASEPADPEAGPDAGRSEQPADSEETATGPGTSGVRWVLEEARGYLESAPPVGRVRSAFAPGGARMLRADGPGWSLVARTDDIAFILLDDDPGQVHPVGRGAQLPALLEALDAMAVRPS
ncbi:hypothetical protein ACIQ9Q_05370 [Streptomyces sp. NPDC094438]|uniref:hypothetical protein n=1 Tax=Streptomyces sp. NPDC094438 TaxID=3366061 RepID=UPI0037FD911F